MKHPSRLHSLALGLVGLAAGCTVHLGTIGGPSGPIVVGGQIVGPNGEYVSGATLTDGTASATSSSDGSYTLTIDMVRSREKISVKAAGYAPTELILTPRPGVFHYLRSLHLVRPVTMVMNPQTGGQMTITSMGQPVQVTVPPNSMNTNGNVVVNVAAYDLDDGPGALDTTGAPGMNRLQTLGMFRVDVQDMNGNPVTMVPGTGVRFDIPRNPPAIMDAEQMEIWQLNGDGFWDTPTPTTTATGADLIAQNAGYWNADRAYRTACVRGHATASSRTCGGTHVTAHGLDGIASQDTSGADGSFCVEGPQTVSTSISFGSRQISVSMPAAPGNCATNLAACDDIGEVQVNDSDCLAGCPMGMVDSPTGCVRDNGGGSGDRCVGNWLVSAEFTSCNTCSGGAFSTTITVSGSGNSLSVSGLPNATIDPSSCRVEAMGDNGEHEVIDLLNGNASVSEYCYDSFCGMVSGTVSRE